MASQVEIEEILLDITRCKKEFIRDLGRTPEDLEEYMVVHIPLNLWHRLIDADLENAYGQS